VQVLLRRKLHVSVGKHFLDKCEQWLNAFDRCIHAFMILIDDDNSTIMPGFREGCMAITTLLDPPLLKRVLRKCDPDEVIVTQKVFKWAVANCNVPEKLELLLEKNSKLSLDQEILISASRNGSSSKILDYLFNRTDPPLVPETEITQHVLENTVEYYMFSSSSAYILDKVPTLSITEDVLVCALKNNSNSTNVKLLLDRIQTSAETKTLITERVLAAATDSFPSSLQAVLEANPSLTIDEAGFITLLTNAKFKEGKEILEVFKAAKQTQNFTITQRMLKIAVRTSRLQTLRWLLRQDESQSEEIRRKLNGNRTRDGWDTMGNNMYWNNFITPGEDAQRILEHFGSEDESGNASEIIEYSRPPSEASSRVGSEENDCEMRSETTGNTFMKVNYWLGSDVSPDEEVSNNSPDTGMLESDDSASYDSESSHFLSSAEGTRNMRCYRPINICYVFDSDDESAGVQKDGVETDSDASSESDHRV
jgi:hypothetical protein